MYCKENCAPCKGEQKASRGCGCPDCGEGCSGCGGYEYTCRVVCTPRGNLIYFNDCYPTKLTCKVGALKSL